MSQGSAGVRAGRLERSFWLDNFLNPGGSAAALSVGIDMTSRIGSHVPLLPCGQPLSRLRVSAIEPDPRPVNSACSVAARIDGPAIN
jgi:hypothetical protein